MKIGFLGTGNLTVALGRVWAAAGHEIYVAGRSSDNSAKAAAEFGGTPTDPAGLAAAAEVIVVAVAWEGLEPMLALAGAPEGSFAGKPVIDCTNALDFATGRLKVETGSAAEYVASLTPGAHVVKALHLFAGASWRGNRAGAEQGGDTGAARDVAAGGERGGDAGGERGGDAGAVRAADAGGERGVDGGAERVIVAICGDDADALAITSELIHDLGGKAAVVGGLGGARQLEEAAGFVMSVVAAGHNPRSAVPDFQPTNA